MPSLKDLKNRIASVKSTRKITSAMKMVAASKFRRAQEHAEASRPYARRMAETLSNLLEQSEFDGREPRLIKGTGKSNTVLLIVMTSDRGLCGGFNTALVRETRRRIAQFEAEGKAVKLVCVGRKGRDLLRRQYGDNILYTQEVSKNKHIGFADADELSRHVLELFEEGAFDLAYVVYNQFKSAISQVVTVRQLIPFVLEGSQNDVPASTGEGKGQHAVLDLFEPSRERIILRLLPRNISVQLLSCLHESAAGEQGARMTAMDNATRNAGDMIDRLTQNYNRSRQAYITKELIEIISGAEAL